MRSPQSQLIKSQERLNSNLSARSTITSHALHLCNGRGRAFNNLHDTSKRDFKYLQIRESILLAKQRSGRWELENIFW